MSKPELELSQEVVCGQKSFELMTLDTVRIEQLNGRRPLRPEALERLGLLLDVDLHGDKVVADETLNA